jgi:hypothetical protein
MIYRKGKLNKQNSVIHFFYPLIISDKVRQAPCDLEEIQVMLKFVMLYSGWVKEF